MDYLLVMIAHSIGLKMPLKKGQHGFVVVGDCGFCHVWHYFLFSFVVPDKNKTGD